MSSHNPQEPVYMISIAAQLTGMHPQTIRLYERVGLVAPKRVNNKNRLYSEADIERLQRIRLYTQVMGVNLAGVEIILDLLRKMETMQQEMEQMRLQMETAGGRKP